MTAPPRGPAGIVAGHQGRLPDWVVVGAMKAGTTSVAAWLKSHPDAWLVPNKEVHFFNRDDLHARGESWYRRQFEGAPEHASIGEGSPSYLFAPDAPARMAVVIPEARLIACLRDPVDRAYSHYWHNRRHRLEARPFAEAVAAERGDPAWRPPGYLMRGRYLQQIERMLDHYPATALLAVLTDDLEHEPTATFASICRHVGLDESVAPTADERRNASHEYRAPRFYAAMFKYHLWRWLPPGVRGRVGSAFVRPAAYPPIDPDLATELYDWFAEDDAALAAWLGRDLPWR